MPIDFTSLDNSNSNLNVDNNTNTSNLSEPIKQIGFAAAGTATGFLIGEGVKAGASKIREWVQK